MKRAEVLSRLFICAGMVLAIGVPVLLWSRTPLIHVSMAERGGWNPDIIKAKVGETLHLRITSDDVVHGFAIGQMDMEAVDVMPGIVTEVSLTFDTPGIYTFFCTRWCGLNHWRMRGLIEVTGTPMEPGTVTTPLYVTLGLDIDEPHRALVTPAIRPSASRGAAFIARLKIDKTREYYLIHSPFEMYIELSGSPLTEGQRWDVVASVWHSSTTRESLANGRRLYAQNCAACHGENGGGDGIFADNLALAEDASMQAIVGSQGMSQQTPVDFTDPQRLLGASPALLQGKILRGGMGTGMPMWGSIFTEQQIWDLVSYLYSFQFEYPK